MLLFNITMVLLVILLLCIVYYYGITRQIGATCGFYDIAYILLKIRNNDAEPKFSAMHNKVAELLKEADASGINTYVGEIFDINTLELLCQKNGMKAKQLSSAYFFHNIGSSGYELSRYKYYIVPIQTDSPHFVVVARKRDGTLTIWDSNDFLTNNHTLSKIKTMHEGIPEQYDWKSYVKKISLLSNPGFIIGRTVKMALLRLKYNGYISDINQKENRCKKEYETYNSTVNLKGYVIGIWGLDN